MTKTVKLDDESAVLYLEGSDGTMEVDDNDTGSKCECGCGCKELFWSIASSFCRMCQQGACDCTDSAIAARIADGACPECTEYRCECPDDQDDEDDSGYSCYF